jgi:hypothetical protein
VNVGGEMATIMKRGTYTLAAAAYMFLASGYLSQLLDPMPPASLLRFPFLFKLVGSLSPFLFSIALAPLCIIAARSRPRYALLLLSYVGLPYVGMLGKMVIGGELPTFGPGGAMLSWQDYVSGSLSFLGIFAVLNFIPTAAIWGVARAFVLTCQPS